MPQISPLGLNCAALFKLDADELATVAPAMILFIRAQREWIEAVERQKMPGWRHTAASHRANIDAAEGILKRLPAIREEARMLTKSDKLRIQAIRCLNRSIKRSATKSPARKGAR